MNNKSQNDKLIQVFSCDMQDGDDRQEKWKKGKLFLMEKSLHFCPIFNYSATTFGFNQQLIKLQYSQIKQFDENDELDQLTITTHKNNQLYFKNFYAQRPQIMEILNSINLKIEQFEPILENDIYDWDACNVMSQQTLPNLLQLKEGNQYNPPTIFELEGLDIHEIFALLYDDIPYKPSEYFQVAGKEVDKNKQYQNVLHFFFEQILGDQEIKCLPWYPLVPEYLRCGDPSKGPSLEQQQLQNLPTREINYVHPTKLPFFGTINPKVKMIQRLLLINQNEFIVQVQSETSGLPKSDSYRMMSHERAIQIGPKKFRIECTFTIEWKSRIMIISNQVDNAGAIESKRVLDTYYIPYARARLMETIKLKELKNGEQNRSEIIGEQPSVVHLRRQVKSESQILQSKFMVQSAKNLDQNLLKIQELEMVQKQLENQIKQLQLQSKIQEKQISKISEEQQALILISRTLGIVILFILLTNWLMK